MPPSSKASSTIPVGTSAFAVGAPGHMATSEIISTNQAASGLLESSMQAQDSEHFFLVDHLPQGTQKKVEEVVQNAG